MNSTEESVKDAAGVQKGMSLSVFGGRLLTSTARTTRSVTRTPRPPQDAFGNSTTIPAVRVASASPAPHAVSPAPASSLAPRAFSRPRSRSHYHSPVQYKSVEEIYAWQLHLARLQDTTARIVSRRRHQLAIAAINQVEMEEQAKGVERRERRGE